MSKKRKYYFEKEIRPFWLLGTIMVIVSAYLFITSIQLIKDMTIELRLMHNITGFIWCFISIMGFMIGIIYLEKTEIIKQEILGVSA